MFLVAYCFVARSVLWQRQLKKINYCHLSVEAFRKYFFHSSSSTFVVQERTNFE